MVIQQMTKSELTILLIDSSLMIHLNQVIFKSLLPSMKQLHTLRTFRFVSTYNTRHEVTVINVNKYNCGIFLPIWS